MIESTFSYAEINKMDNHIHLKINLQCMYVVGAYDLKFKNKFLSFIYNRIYSKLVVGYLMCFVITQYMEILTNLSYGPFYVVSILGVSLLYSDTICKALVCGGPKIMKLIDQIKETETRILSYENNDLKEIYYDHVKWNYKADRLLIWVGGITVLPFYVSPILIQISDDYVKEYDGDGYEMRPLPFITWFPFNRFQYYPIAYLYHMLAGMAGGSLTVSTDILFVGLMTFAIGQIKILQYSFRNSKRLAENLAKNAGIPLEEAIVITIGYCVRMHKIIIKYIKTLDSAMRILMLFDFSVASLQMAMLGIQIVVVGFGWQQLFVLEYLSAMFVQLFLFYWHANEIILESIGIASAIWDSDWMNYTTSVKKSLMLVMMRAQKPLTLSVGPFYIMSTQTALSVSLQI
nr:odorant receptor 49b-like [Onthophagus taurus]